MIQLEPPAEGVNKDTCGPDRASEREFSSSFTCRAVALSVLTLTCWSPGLDATLTSFFLGQGH